MKQFLLSLGFACTVTLFAVGCGGHEGGEIEIPADNPYQITPEEQAQQSQSQTDTGNRDDVPDEKKKKR